MRALIIAFLRLLIITTTTTSVVYYQQFLLMMVVNATPLLTAIIPPEPATIIKPALFCEPLQRFNPTVCANSVDYNVTIRPNLLGHLTQEDSQKALLEYNKVFGNAESNCAELFELFACALYLPQCVIVDEPAGQPAIVMNTCYHTLCLDAREQCENWLSLIGMSWPLTLDCDNLFPADPPHCFYPVLKTNGETDAKIARLLQEPTAAEILSSITNRGSSHQTPVIKIRATTTATKPAINLLLTKPVQQADDDSSGESSRIAWIRINVGGEIFLSTKATLCRGSHQSALLRKMFKCDDHGEETSTPTKRTSSSSSSYNNNNNNNNNSRFMDKNGTYLINRDPIYFRVILNYLRSGKLVIDDGVSDEGVLEEANYFNLTSLARLVKRRIRRKQERLEDCNIN